MRTRLLIVLVLFSTLSIPVLAQRNKTEEHKIKNITTWAVGSGTQTPEQVKQMAIDKAKIEALKAAGIEENINSYSDYFRSESDGKMSDLFTSDILSNIKGNVKNVEIVTHNNEFTPEGNIKVTVTINCTVVEYKTSKDLMFESKIDGIKMMYTEGDLLTFKVWSSGDAYLRVFMFATEDFIIFPNNWEQSFMLKANETYEFPQKIEITLDAGGAKKETNRLVFVLLKRDIPYTGDVDYKLITDWIMSIPPDERAIKSFGFEVVKQ